MASPSSSKRIKLAHGSSPEAESLLLTPELDAEVDEDICTICLQPIADRAVIPTCSHEFCFECLMIWSEQSRRCPLCTQNIGDYLIHRIRSTYDYQKHFLPPLRTSPRPLARADGARIAPVHTRRDRVWGPRDRAAQDEADALERAVGRRRWVYQHDLYAKHVASNKYTRYRPFPTPAQFAASQDLVSRMTVFLRRELLVWPNADVEFLVTFVISLMKSIDIRSESAIKLLAEFLDMDTPYAPGKRHVNAEHFAHEIYCYLRSPYRDLGVYDSVVQYDAPPAIPPPPSYQRTRRWYSVAPQSRSPSPHLPQSHPRSPPSIQERHLRPERSPQSRTLSYEQGLISPHSQARDSGVHRDISSGAHHEDDRPEGQSNSTISETLARSKGKQRAPARPPTSLPQCDTCNSQRAHHGRISSPEILIPSISLLFRKNHPDRSSAPDSPPADDVHRGDAMVPELPDDSPGHSPVVVSPQFLDGDRSGLHTIPTDKPHLPLEDPHSLNDQINASSSSELETPELVAMNLNHAHANPIRQSRYRSQRDSIIAYLRKASETTPRPPSSVRRRNVPSLLMRMTDGTVAKPNDSEADTDKMEGTGDGGHVRLPSRIGIAERSSGPSVNDDPSRRTEEETVTNTGMPLRSTYPRNAGANVNLPCV
ncbi:hypothetical protein F5148DRAFT_1258756 [Russula earlei]|uniref:Uncharacterized protein n=1 Tax=Russula earlei TaxID=71964 RepID=A0ACC0TSE6_9AGAM|nr:hypothetical protein F5148DRAFT_1258756 [Russula earlei]